MHGSSDDAGGSAPLRGRAGDVVFISYRAGDSDSWAARLADDLRACFGSDRIRRDADGVQQGDDHRRRIDDVVAASRVTIAVLGPHWLLSTNGDGTRRLDDPQDTVRRALEHSLKRGIAVVPVLVGGARMPAPADLPHSLRALARLDARVLREEGWRDDFAHLVETLGRHGLSRPTALAGDGERETASRFAEREVTRTVRYRRTLRTTVPDAFAAISSAVELLRYPVREKDAEAAEVHFSALARTVRAKVVEAVPGQCTVVVEFTSLSWMGSGGSALVILPGVLLGAAVKAHDAYFAKGFLENVKRVLEGKGVGRDSARLPGMSALREKLDVAEG